MLLLPIPTNTDNDLMYEALQQYDESKITV